MIGKRKILPGRTIRAALCLTVTGLLAGAGLGQAAELKIVSINTGQVLQAHPSFLNARNTFQSRIEEMQAQLGRMDETEQQARAMQMQREIQELGQKLQEEAFTDLKRDLQKIADENGYDFVVDKEALLVGQTVPDITEQVLASLPEAEAAPSVPVPAQPDERD